jgi:hypothetical protein
MMTARLRKRYPQHQRYQLADGHNVTYATLQYHLSNLVRGLCRTAFRFWGMGSYLRLHSARAFLFGVL